MIRQAWPKAIQRRYSLTSKAISFIPNDNKYYFESESLTPEENRTAIPKRPTLKNVPKLYNNILKPQYVADVVINPKVNDIIITALAAKKPFTGDMSYKVTTINNTENGTEPEPVPLIFENLAIKWLKEFQGQIKQLKDIEEAKDPLIYQNSQLEEQINLFIEQFGQPINSEVSFEKFVAFINIENNYKKKSKGNLHLSELQLFITFDKLIQTLLKNCQSNSEWAVILQNSGKYLQYFSTEELSEFITQLTTELFALDDKVKYAIFSKFLESTKFFENHAYVMQKLDTITLDNLAFIMLTGKDLSSAHHILLEVVNRGFAPTLKTFNLFVEVLEPSITSKASALKVLVPYKSVIFHHKLSPVSFHIILDNVITTSYELQHFIALISINSSNFLSTYQTQILQKLIDINANKENSLKALEITQLIRRLVVDLKVQFTDETKKLLKSYFESLHMEFKI